MIIKWKYKCLKLPIFKNNTPAFGWQRKKDPKIEASLRYKVNSRHPGL